MGAKLSTGTAAGAELTASLSPGQEQLGKPVLPARRILPAPDAFANPSPAAMGSGAGSSLFRRGIARGFQQVFICKTHPWISLKFRGKSVPAGLGEHKSPSRVPFLPGGCAGASPALLHLPRMWLRRGHSHREHTEVVFFQEAKPTAVFFLNW